MVKRGGKAKARGSKADSEPIENEVPSVEERVEESEGKTASVQPANSARSRASTTSAVAISQLREQLRVRDEQLKERDDRLNVMEDILRSAGLMKGQDLSDPIIAETEGESRAPPLQMPREKMVVPEREGETFKTFMSCKPTVYKGGEDPLECIRWVRKMEQVFESGKFTEKQKVSYAVRVLEGEALDWWETVRQSLSAENRALLTWDRFMEKLRTRFCSSAAVQRMEREFTHLVKGDMSIAKYNITFYDKLQFCRHLCPTESRLVNRYAEGLPASFRGIVRSKDTIEEAMEEARRMEDDFAESEKTPGVGEKRKADGAADFKKDNGKQKKRDADFCRNCQKSHQGRCDKADIKCHKCAVKGHYANECPEKSTTCYNCGESGHIATKCTKPRNVKARAYQMTARDLLND